MGNEQIVAPTRGEDTKKMKGQEDLCLKTEQDGGKKFTR